MRCYRCLELEAQGIPGIMVCPVCGTEDVDSHKTDACKDTEPVERSAAIPGITGRHGFAHKFAEFLERIDLKPGKECTVERDASKRYYRICWTLGVGELGGEVHIYGEEWIRVQWDGDIEWAPMRGSRIFDSAWCAEQFMISAFIEKSWNYAQLIPEKPPKGEK